METKEKNCENVVVLQLPEGVFKAPTCHGCNEATEFKYPDLAYCKKKGKWVKASNGC